MVLCREKGLAISLRRNFITISSPRSKWRILADDNRNRTMLYHCNDFDYENASPVPGYHNQHVNYATLQEYLDYIIDHDYYRMMHPLYPAPQPKAPPVKGRPLCLRASDGAIILLRGGYAWLPLHVGLPTYHGGSIAMGTT